jgi:hypothetical protein
VEPGGKTLEKCRFRRDPPGSGLWNDRSGCIVYETIPSFVNDVMVRYIVYETMASFVNHVMVRYQRPKSAEKVQFGFDSIR